MRSDAAAGLERYLGSLAHTWPSREAPRLPAEAWPRVVTISRQAGSGAHVVGEELAAMLRDRTRPGSTPWTVFDRNLVEQVLKEHDLPERLAEYMPEDRVSEITDTLDELFGVHPAVRTLVRKTADTILHLAELGNVIIIGRGATVITGRLGYAFHVRLIGSEERRIAYIQEQLGLGPREAAEYVRTADVRRKRYVKKYYDVDVEDPLLYHLVINTDRVPYVEAARLISDAVLPPAEGSRAVGPAAAVARGA